MLSDASNQFLLSSFACLALCACSPDQQTPQIDHIELHISGSLGRSIALSRDGMGTVRQTHLWPRDRPIDFKISHEEVEGIYRRLEEFRRSARPFSKQSLTDMAEMKCPEGGYGGNDAAVVYVRWTGPNLDQHYQANVNCQSTPEQRRARSLLDIAKQLETDAGEHPT